MPNKINVVPVESIQKTILVIRGQRIMLDADLALLYGVTTKRLNEQVKRNRGRFPGDFMFQLTPDEKTEVVANCDHLGALKFSPTLPHAFTEHGAIMLASVLNSSRAVEISVYVVRAFIELREMLAGNKELTNKLDQLESLVVQHDGQIRSLFDSIRYLMARPDMAPPAISRKAGFKK